MDGYEESKKIRLFNKELPIIVLSANAYAEDAEKSLDTAMNAHLVKPLVKDELLETLYELIE